MTPQSIIGRLRANLQRFRSASGGNVVTMFALSLIPVMGAMGAVVDYSRANSVKVAMQAAADSTALMIAKDAATLSDAQLQAKANSYFTALFNRPEATGLLVNATYSSSSGSQINLTASSSVKTDFMEMMGFSTMKVAVTSQAKWGNVKKMQVALALDNTGSMAEYNKMASLKTATVALLNQLKAAAANPNDVNVAIVPFAKDVNVGVKNVNAPWIDWTAWNAAHASSSTTPPASGSICYFGMLWQVSGSSFSFGGHCSSPSTGICYNGTLWNFNGSQLVNGGACGSGATVDHSSWNGCVTDRTQDYDTTNASPNPATAATLFVAEQYNACPVEMRGLTNNWTELTGLVNSMIPNGNTNQAIGLAWAWHALSTGTPMNAPAKNADTQQIIILLTDGLNTQDRWYNDQASIDARQKILCTNIKAASVTLYTIQVNVGNMDPLSTMLQQCASKPEYFFHLTTAGAIATVFDAIGTNLTKLRIAM